MDPDGSLWIIRALVLLALCAFFTMSETAMVTLNDAKLRKQAASGHRKAMLIAALVDSPSRFFATAKLGFMLCAFFAFVTGTHGVSRHILGFVWRGAQFDNLGNVLYPSAFTVHGAFVAAGLLASLLILVLGDLVPKRVAVRHHEAVAYACARPFALFARLARPAVALLFALSGLLLRALGIDPNSSDDALPEEEIRMLLDEGSEEGSIEEDEREMINNIFDFEDTEVCELMIHRTDVVALELGAELHEVVQTAIEGGCTRMPVYDGDLDSIVGILNVKDLIGLITRPPGHSFDLRGHLREPLYAAESMSCKLLFAALKEKKTQMAVVVDEYGGTAGIITMEDLLEGIVGSIQDEYDDEEDEISATGAGLYTIDGIADFEEVCETLALEPGQDDDGEEFETIGGYIVHKLGRIPGEDEQPSIQIGDMLFTVQAMEDRRIARLRAERLPEQPREEASAAPEI